MKLRHKIKKAIGWRVFCSEVSRELIKVPTPLEVREEYCDFNQRLNEYPGIIFRARKYNKGDA